MKTNKNSYKIYEKKILNTKYPKPMNLETRFALKQASPSKYRCLSCTKQRKRNINDSSVKFRPNAHQPKYLTSSSKSIKKSILEAQLLMSRGKLK